jgi:hypothetical protein
LKRRAWTSSCYSVPVIGVEPVPVGAAAVVVTRAVDAAVVVTTATLVGIGNSLPDFSPVDPSEN